MLGALACLLGEPPGACGRRAEDQISGTTIYAVERMETGADISGTAMVKGEAAIKTALEAEGIEFIDDADVPRRA